METSTPALAAIVAAPIWKLLPANCDSVLSLYYGFCCYFKISNKLPNPYSLLSETVPSDMIKEANKIVEQSTQNASTKRGRVTYLKFTPIQQAQVAKYAVDNGNQVAICQHSNEFCAEIKVSSFTKYMEI